MVSFQHWHIPQFRHQSKIARQPPLYGNPSTAILLPRPFKEMKIIFSKRFWKKKIPRVLKRNEFTVLNKLVRGCRYLKVIWCFQTTLDRKQLYKIPGFIDHDELTVYRFLLQLPFWVAIKFQLLLQRKKKYCTSKAHDEYIG